VIGKRKREEDQEKQEKINNDISKYFSAKATTKAPKAKVKSRLHDTDPTVY
jgi:DNA polymerase alpha subunit A